MRNKNISLIVLASIVGSLIEWYDFYIFGALSLVISTKFFPEENPTLAFWATLFIWGAGLLARPIGAIYFGKIGDSLGRKLAFTKTLMLMSGATIGIGLIPTYESIGLFAPILIFLLRFVQGFAWGGGYSGAAIILAEHVVPGQRGFWTSWLQASALVAIGLASMVILGVKNGLSEQNWDIWGWRIPFLFSFVLLIISYFFQKKSQESPVFLELKARKEEAKDPLHESFFVRNNLKILLLALLSVCLGAGVMGYSSIVFIHGFMTKYMQLPFNQYNRIVIILSLLSCPIFIFFGWLSDRIGRKYLILLSFLLAILFFQPIFKILYSITDFPTTKETFLLKRISYPKNLDIDTSQKKYLFSDGSVLYESIMMPKNLQEQNIFKKNRTLAVSKNQDLKIIGLVLCICIILAMSHSPLLAFLIEMFPPKIRYTSVSLPYQLAFGIFGGVSPLLSTYLIEQGIANHQEDFYLEGLIYGTGMMSIALVIGLLFLKEKMVYGIDNKPEYFNKIIRLSGWVWIILSILSLYLGIFQIGFVNVFEGVGVAYVFGLVVAFLITPLLSISLFLFGRLAIKGAYDY